VFKYQEGKYQESGDQHSLFTQRYTEIAGPLFSFPTFAGEGCLCGLHAANKINADIPVRQSLGQWARTGLRVKITKWARLSDRIVAGAYGIDKRGDYDGL
jgi:hypothetical protein